MYTPTHSDPQFKKMVVISFIRSVPNPSLCASPFLSLSLSLSLSFTLSFSFLLDLGLAAHGYVLQAYMVDQLGNLSFLIIVFCHIKINMHCFCFQEHHRMFSLAHALMCAHKISVGLSSTVNSNSRGTVSMPALAFCFKLSYL